MNIRIPITKNHMAFAAATDHLDGDELDLGELLIPHPDRSILYRVPDDARSSDGIFAGDYVIVERGRAPKPGELLLATQDDATRLARLTHDLPPAHVEGTATLVLRKLVAG